MAIKFEITGQPWIWCGGNWYKPGETIEALEGATLKAFLQIKRTDNDPQLEAKGIMYADAAVNRCKSDSKWFYVDDTYDLDCSFKMPGAQESLWLKACHIVDDHVYEHDRTTAYTLIPSVTPAKGKITKIDAPAELGEGDEIDVIATMKNEGGDLGEFRFYLLDENGNTIDKEPDTSYKDVVASATWTQNLTSVWKPWDMPDHDVVLTMDLRRKT